MRSRALPGGRIINSSHMKTIDVTPTWAGLLNGLLAVYANSKNAEAINTVHAELVKMARAADAYNELLATPPTVEVLGPNATLVNGTHVFSYNTHVADLDGDRVKVYGKWSRTTSKHITLAAGDREQVPTVRHYPPQKGEQATGFFTNQNQ